MEKNEPSELFLERKALLDLEKEIVELRHQFKMQELNFQREISKAEHEERMSEIRLKNANIERTLARRQEQTQFSHYQQ